MEVNNVKRLKELEDENVKLKKRFAKKSWQWLKRDTVFHHKRGWLISQ
ncbi:hypothetical protein LDO51_00230 [Providencia alcalifaciens]|nr:hypothetical protein LDO51_00230 [Providencia alcalifaciens]